MRYELSEHARTVMAERRIPQEWVERVMGEPAVMEEDREDADLEHRLGVISTTAQLCRFSCRGRLAREWRRHLALANLVV